MSLYSRVPATLAPWQYPLRDRAHLSQVETYEGKAQAIGDHQARELLNAPNPGTLKGKRDRAMLSALLYHGLRREELCSRKVRDISERRDVAHLRIHGKGGKLRYLPVHPGTDELILEYVDALGCPPLPSLGRYETI